MNGSVENGGSLENETQEIDAIESFEIEEEQRLRRRRQPKLWCVVLRYLAASTLALALTVSSSDTRLWQSDGSMHVEYMFEIFLVYVLTLGSLASVFGSDPGYLDKDFMARISLQDGLTLLGHEETECEEEEEEPLSLDSPSSEVVTRRTTTLVNNNNDAQETEALTSDTSLLFQGTRRKICDKCGFAPPLRSHHCRICNKCVATFDHHCVFIGTCIGERNHCRFWWFLSFQLLGFCVCSHTVSTSTLKWSSQSGGYVVVLVAKLYLYPLTAAAALMWITHTLWAFMNLTTFECGKGSSHIDYLRGTQPMDLPFSNGLDSNLSVFCCQRDSCCHALTGNSTQEWQPILWQTPGKIVRDSDDIWENPWQNKYWSCC